MRTRASSPAFRIRGRARPRLQGARFRGYKDGSAPVAQLDRASDYGSEGREFESSLARHPNPMKGIRKGLNWAASLIPDVGQATNNAAQPLTAAPASSAVSRAGG